MKIIQYYTGPIQVNTYLVYDEDGKKAFIVDPGGHSDKLLDDIKCKDLIVEYIILTHGHGDHIGGVNGLKRSYPQIKLVACTKERELLANPKLNVSKDLFGYPISLKADIYVGDEQEMYVGNILLHFLETPGHTPGGMSIVVDNVVFSGDTLFRQSIGRTDFYGGSMPELVNSIKTKLFTLPDDTKVLPGHMGSTEIGFEKRHNYFV